MFSWKPIYAEIAAKLLEYETDNGALVDLMRQMHDQGLKASPYLDQDADGKRHPLTEIDPFSFFANFNRGITDANRRSILQLLKTEWNLAAPIPEEFLGVPVVNAQRSWLMPWSHERDPSHVSTLWQLYRHCLETTEVEDLDTVLFDRCRALNYVGPATLTMGMFWTKPDVWYALDANNVAHAKELGVTVEPGDGNRYVQWLQQVRQISQLPPYQFSCEAEQALRTRKADGAASKKGKAKTARGSSGKFTGDYWLIAPGEQARLWDEWIDQGIAAIGWNTVGDLRDLSSKAEVAEAVAEAWPNSGAQYVAGMMWNFARNLKIGDVVLARMGRFKIIGWGVVTGGYRYEEEDDELVKYANIVPVEWKERKEVTMPEGTFLSMNTLTRVTDHSHLLPLLAEAFPEIPGLASPKGGDVQQPPEGGTTTKPPKEEYPKADALKDLFMPESTVDQILRLLRRKKNVILQGAPGTGKTFVAKRLAYLLLGEKDESRVPMMQFHQSMSYEDFIQGYRPDGKGGFSLHDGSFHRFCQQAMKYPKADFVLVLDEINRGNLSKIFGELLMLIEPDKRGRNFAIPLSYAPQIDETFYVPENVHLIGTMNTADRSLSLVDYALRRRFAFVELNPGFDSNVFADVLGKGGASDEIVETIRFRMKTLNEMIEKDAASLGRGFRIGHSFFVPAEDQIADQAWLNEIVEYEIVPLLEEYWCDDETRLEEAKQIARGQM